MKIQLTNKKWHKDGSIFCIGKAFTIEDKLLENKELAEYFKTISSKELIIEKASQLKGFFTIIFVGEAQIFVICDHLRSYPIFWTKNGGSFCISDDSYSLLAELSVKEVSNVETFLSLGYVPFEETLFKNIFQITPGSWIVFKNNGVYESNRYIQDLTYADRLFDKDNFFYEMNTVLEKITKRTIQFLNGRKAVIPLSDGEDSRQIAYYLKKCGYSNIIAFTYGKKNSVSSSVSKRVADYLGINWYFIEYESKRMQNIYYDSSLYSKFTRFCANGFSVPHIQDWYAIEELRKRKIIDDNSIIIPGHTGDFLAGNHIEEIFINKQSVTADEFIDSIFKRHFVLNKVNSKKLLLEKKEEILKHYGLKSNQVISSRYASNLAELFNFEERQSKLICNSVKTYELYDMEWYLPLWDRQLVELWMKVPLEQRFGRRVFTEFTKYEYPELTEKIPVRAKYSKNLKTQFTYKYKNKKGFRSMYSFMHIIWKFFRVFTDYDSNELNFYGYIKRRHYLKTFFTTHNNLYYFIFARDYVKHLKNILKKMS